MTLPDNRPFQAWVKTETFPIAGQFRISRETKTVAEVITVTILADQTTGHAECVPYARYGESMDSVKKTIQTTIAAASTFRDLAECTAALPAGAARNVLDCALWDVRAKAAGHRIHTDICANPPRPVRTAFTLSLDTPENMADAARRACNRSLLKIKLGGPDDIACMHAVVANAPNSDIIIDANEAWNAQNLAAYMREAAQLRIALIEQPLPAGDDAMLAAIPHPVPVCADESAHQSTDLDVLTDRYDVINIKLDKAGGLTEALKMRRRAHELGFGIMVGCMVGTSLAMAPAVLLAQEAEYVDLDGPLLLSRDRTPALHYYGELVSPPEKELWG